jgi:hypothetical protein
MAGQRICNKNWEVIQQQITNPKLMDLGCRNASAGERDVSCCDDVKEGLLLDLPDECTTKKEDEKKDRDTALALSITLPVVGAILLAIARCACKRAWNRGWRPCGMKPAQGSAAVQGLAAAQGVTGAVQLSHVAATP